MDIDEILTSDEFPGGKNGFRFLICNKNKKPVILLCIRLSQMIVYVRNLYNAKSMYFFVKDEDLLKKYNKIWEKVRNIMKERVDGEAVYDNKSLYLKTKAEFYNNNHNANFYSSRIHKEGSSCLFLSIIMIYLDFELSKID